MVFRYYRETRAGRDILIVSLGVMFVIAGLIRFIIGPNDRSLPMARFILKAREFKKMTGLSEGLSIRQHR